ncbi:MAG: response regulator, partial [Variovorax sp.]
MNSAISPKRVTQEADTCPKPSPARSLVWGKATARRHARVSLWHQGGVMRVLMVDDHMMVLQGLRSLLRVLMNDLEIDMASSLPTALALAGETRYDLVLLDWNLDD